MICPKCGEQIDAQVKPATVAEIRAVIDALPARDRVMLSPWLRATYDHDGTRRRGHPSESETPQPSPTCRAVHPPRVVSTPGVLGEAGRPRLDGTRLGVDWWALKRGENIQSLVREFEICEECVRFLFAVVDCVRDTLQVPATPNPPPPTPADMIRDLDAPDPPKPGDTIQEVRPNDPFRRFRR